MAVPAALLPRQWRIPRGADRARVAEQVRVFVAALDTDKPWRVVVESDRPTRSNAQNRYLYGVAYRVLAQETGYEVEEIAEFCAGSYFGWRDVKVPKTPRNPEGIESRPVRTTTTDEHGKRAVLDKQAFSDYVAWIQRFAASKGLYIPEPDELEAAA